jgi:hypothetical protein
VDRDDVIDLDALGGDGSFFQTVLAQRVLGHVGVAYGPQSQHVHAADVLDHLQVLEEEIATPRRWLDQFRTGILADPRTETWC